VPNVIKPAVVIRPFRGTFDLDLISLYRSWELLYFLVWRDVKVRYKQTFLGVAWAVLQPVITMLLFTAVFGRLAGLSSNGLPYPVFSLIALVPWMYFSQAVGRASTSVVNNAGLVTKVYFPRLAIPISAVLAPLVDLAAGLGVVALLLAWYRMMPGWNLLALPFLVLLCGATALAYRCGCPRCASSTETWALSSPSCCNAGCGCRRWPTRRTPCRQSGGSCTGSIPWSA
jgi:lipopolysaccharide transport system permease protein